MSGDIPVSFVFASCPPEQVAPLSQVLDDLSFGAWCAQHEDTTCLPLGTLTTDYEAYANEVHEMFADLTAAAPGAGLAVIGGPSGDGPGILLLHHPTLGRFREDVAPSSDGVAPMFTQAQVEEIFGSASTSDEVDLALGMPWTRQFAPLPAGCQSRYPVQDLAAQAELLRWSQATGALAVQRTIRDTSGQSWAIATWRAGGSVVLTGDGAEYRVTDRGSDLKGAESALARRLRWLRRD